MNFAKSGSESIVVHWRIDQWFPEIPESQRAQLKKFHDELLKFNKSLNLIGVKTIPMADAIHFADSILAGKIILKNTNHKEIYDLGSGNGFPGVVVAIMSPQTKIYLVDVDQRKSEFLKHLSSALNLKNIEVMVRPIENIGDGAVKCGFSRGLATISKSLLMTRKIFPVGGSYFHLKGEEWATEIADMPTQLCSYWNPGLVGNYKLPVGEVKFAVVKTEKIKE